MKIHSVGEDESEFVFVIIKVASSSLGREGKGVIHVLAVRPPLLFMMLRIGLLQNISHRCMTHPAHLLSPRICCGHGYFSGPGRPVLSSSPCRAPRLLRAALKSQVCLSSAIIRPLLSAFWCSASCEAVTARFAGPLFVTKSLNAIHVNSEVQRPDIGCNFTGYNIYIIFIV